MSFSGRSLCVFGRSSCFQAPSFPRISFIFHMLHSREMSPAGHKCPRALSCRVSLVNPVPSQVSLGSPVSLIQFFFCTRCRPESRSLSVPVTTPPVDVGGLVTLSYQPVLQMAQARVLHSSPCVTTRGRTFLSRDDISAGFRWCQLDALLRVVTYLLIKLSMMI